MPSLHNGLGCLVFYCPTRRPLRHVPCLIHSTAPLLCTDPCLPSLLRCILSASSCQNCPRLSLSLTSRTSTTHLTFPYLTYPNSKRGDCGTWFLLMARTSAFAIPILYLTTFPSLPNSNRVIAVLGYRILNTCVTEWLINADPGLTSTDLTVSPVRLQETSWNSFLDFPGGI
jgi:hypothetical protein